MKGLKEEVVTCVNETDNDVYLFSGGEAWNHQRLVAQKTHEIPGMSGV